MVSAVSALSGCCYVMLAVGVLAVYISAVDGNLVISNVDMHEL